MSHYDRVIFWIVDGIVLVVSLAVGIINYFSHIIVPDLAITLNMQGFDSWLHRIIQILSGCGVLAAITFGYLNYRMNKKKSVFDPNRKFKKRK